MELTCKKKGATLIAALRGELDHHNAAAIREELDARFSSAHAHNLILDLSELKFMDSSGLGILIGRYKTVTALGGKIRIAAPSEQAKRLIQLAGIHKIISVFGTVDDAAVGL